MNNNLLASVSHVVLNLSLEAIVVIILAVVFVAYALYAGRGKMMALVAGLQLSGAFYLTFENLSWFATIQQGGGQTLFFRALVFFVLLVVATSMLRNVIHGEFPFGKLKKLFEAFSLGITFAGLLIAFAFRLLMLGSAYAVSPLAGTLFNSEQALFWWFAASLAALFVASRR